MGEIGGRSSSGTGWYVTAVLLLGDMPGTGHVAGSSAERVVLKGSGGSGEGIPPEGLLELVRQRLHASGAVVALYPAWRKQPALHALRTVRESLETPLVVAVPSVLPPLGLSLLADQLAYLAPYCPPGVVIALASTLPRGTVTGAWVRSVAGIEHIPASLSDHIASYIPGGGFMVISTPKPVIHRITNTAPVGALPIIPAEPVHLLYAAGEDRDVEWLRARLVPAMRAADVRPQRPQPLSPDYWGTKRFVEFVAFSGHPRSLSVAANALRVRRCRWCEQPIATTTCPFCLMVSGQRPTPQGPATSAEAATVPSLPDGMTPMSGPIPVSTSSQTRGMS